MKNEELIDISKLFGENLRKIRKEANLTQDELSEKLDISQKHLSKIETGNQFASAQLISKIANAKRTHRKTGEGCVLICTAGLCFK